MITFSEEESRILGLKVARSAWIEKTNSDSLLKAIIAGDYDICRIRVLTSDKESFSSIDNCGIPFFLNKIMIHSGKKIGDEDLISEFKDGISYEIYDGSQKKELFKIIENSMKNFPEPVFSNYYFEKSVSHEKLIIATQQYADTFTNKENSGKTAILLKDKEEFVGFGLLSFDQNKGHINHYGVREDYAGKHYGAEILRICKDLCLHNSVAYMGGDTMIQNMKGLKSVFAAGGGKAFGLIDFILTPFFSRSQLPVQEILFTPKSKFMEELIPFVIANADSEHLPGTIASIKTKLVEQFNPGMTYVLNISTPVLNQKTLTLVKVFETGHKLAGFSYFESLC